MGRRLPIAISGFVLTGGRSSRMGTDKALLPFRGQPLGKHVADVMKIVCGGATIVGDPVRHAALGYPVIADLHTSIGPLGGIESALSASQTPWILVAACDMPALTPAFLRRLIGEAELIEQAGELLDALLPIPPGGQANPLCAIYHRRILPHIRAAVASGDYKVTRALNNTEMRLLAVDDAGPLCNANTTAEWQAMLKELDA